MGGRKYNSPLHKEMWIQDTQFCVTKMLKILGKACEVYLMDMTRVE
jgi:hypothetical protein